MSYLTATFWIHDPLPVSDQDWDDIHQTLEDAGNEIGLELKGFTTDVADD